MQLRGLVGRLLYKNRRGLEMPPGVPAPKIHRFMLTPPAAAAAESGPADLLAMRGRCRIAARRRRDRTFGSEQGVISQDETCRVSGMS